MAGNAHKGAVADHLGLNTQCERPFQEAICLQRASATSSAGRVCSTSSDFQVTERTPAFHPQAFGLWGRHQDLFPEHGVQPETGFLIATNMFANRGQARAAAREAPGAGWGPDDAMKEALSMSPPEWEMKGVRRLRAEPFF